MSCRLFIDEVGNDDTRSPTERYLSLTGIITKRRAHDSIITPAIEKLKSDFFDHRPPERVVVLHRKEILRREGPFHVLRDEKLNLEWERRVLYLVEKLPYIAITVIIDKHELVRRYPVWQFDPYHYCMRALLERYVMWLSSHKETGDVVAEPRFKKQDKRLKRSFSYLYDHGSEYLRPSSFVRCLTSRDIKYKSKSANVAGLQLVDLIAHPSHQALKAEYTNEAMTAAFGAKIVSILNRSRYRRDPRNGTISGWGVKRLP